MLAVLTQRLLAEDKPFAAWPMAAYPLFAIAALMVVAGRDAGQRTRVELVDASVARAAGEDFYGLYIWHLLAIVLTYKFGWCRPQSVWTTLYALPITVAMAEISYQWIEKPFLRWKERFSRIGQPAAASAEPAVIAET